MYVPVPVGNTLVGNSGSDVEHNNSALSLDTVLQKNRDDFKR